MALQVILIILLIRGPLSYYLPVFLYALGSLVTALVEFWVLSTEGFGNTYFDVFYFNELALDTLLFVTVISLTARASEGSATLKPISRLLYVVVGLALILPFVIFDGAPFVSTSWNDRTAQLLKFGAAIMTLGLWTALVVGRRQDRQFLAVAAGLGVSVAGAALSLGVRTFTDPNSFLRDAADYTHRLAVVAGFLIWCWAFWALKPPSATQPASGPPTTPGDGHA